jgi:shikimate dehydrogenase
MAANKLIGDNTDAPGFTAALAWNGLRPKGKRALIIGAGGSARAVLYGLIEAGAADIAICNRTASKAVRLAKDFAKHGRLVNGAPLDVLDDFDFLAERQLVVNCTPVGLKDDSFIDYDVDSTPSDCLHFDLAYRETPTPFLALAAARGRPTIDGRHMLVHQGALSFKSFTGRRAPLETMAKAIGIKPPKKK